MKYKVTYKNGAVQYGTWNSDLVEVVQTMVE